LKPFEFVNYGGHFLQEVAVRKWEHKWIKKIDPTEFCRKFELECLLASVPYTWDDIFDKLTEERYPHYSIPNIETLPERRCTVLEELISMLNQDTSVLLREKYSDIPYLEKEHILRNNLLD